MNPIGKHMKCCHCDRRDESCIYMRRNVGVFCDVDFNNINECHNDASICGTGGPVRNGDDDRPMGGGDNGRPGDGDRPMPGSGDISTPGSVNRPPPEGGDRPPPRNTRPDDNDRPTRVGDNSGPMSDRRDDRPMRDDNRNQPDNRGGTVTLHL